MSADTTPDPNEVPPVKRERPTMARIRELERERDAERRERAHAEQLARLTRDQSDELRAERDAERAKWEAFDPEALALGQLVAPLEAYAIAVRAGRWGDDPTIDDEVAAAVERLLVAVGDRFGARLVRAATLTTRLGPL